MALLGLFESEDDDPEMEFDGNDRFDFTLSEEKNVKLTKDIDEPSDVDVRYPLVRPFAEAHVKWDDDEKTLRYYLEEPGLDDREQQVMQKIKDNLSEKIDVSLSSIQSREKIIAYLEEKIDELLLELGIKLESESEDRVLYYIYRDYVGLGKVEPLMHDPYVEDIGCDGVGTPIFAVHSEFGSVKTDVVYEDEERLENVVVKLAERAGKYVSYADPLLDGALPDGSRVNASLTEDVTSKGPTFSIRKFQDTPFSTVDMMDLGTANAGVMAYMWIMEQYNQSFLVVGGTSTGKTSFLNSVVSFIPPEEKVVSIEDTRELRLPLENWIPSVTREMISGSSATDVDMDQLLKESFRQNPDYVIVGEVRGEEASVLFQGLSSGHPGAGTMHASSPGAVVKRLITPPISLSPALVEALDALVVMTHAKGVENSARRVKAVHELQKVVESGSARTNEAFSWTARTDSFNKRGDPKLFDQISEDYGVPKNELKEEFEQRKQVLQWLQDKGVTEFDRVADVIASYYKDREKVLNMVNSGEGSLDDVIEAEQEVGVSRPDLLANEAESSAEDSDDIPVKEETEDPEQMDAGQKGEDNPVAELQRRIQQLDKKVEGEVGEDPFKSGQKDVDNPFEA